MLGMLLTGCHIGYLARYDFQTAVTVGGANAGAPAFVEGTVFDTGSVRFQWDINDYGIGLKVRNRTAQPIEFLWNAARYIDEEGRPHELTVDRIPWLPGHGKPGRFPGRVQPRAGRRFEMYPTDYLAAGEPIGSFHPPRQIFVPPGTRVGDTPQAIVELARVNEGKTITVEVPVRIGNRRHDYRFAFTVTDVGARELRSIF